MNKAFANQPVEIDVRALVKSLVRALPYVIVFVGLVSAGIYFGLSQIAPEYRAQATILIETGESELVGTTSTAQETTRIPDREAVASQAQLLQSRDLARAVAQKLKLDTRAEFNPELRGHLLVSDLLAAIGLGRDPSSASAEERILEQFDKNLSVYAIEKSGTIAIDFVAQDPGLAAAGANAVAEEYISMQRAATSDTTADATAWLESEISTLQTKVQEAEAKLEKYRASNGLFDARGQTIATPPQQQLTDPAQARGAEIGQSLSQPKSAAVRANGAGVDLQALEQEVAAQRDQLESYLRRYREALARQQDHSLPADAKIVSRATVPIGPYFPKKLAFTVAGAVAFLLLAIAGILMRALAGGRAMRRVVPGSIPVVPEVTPVQAEGRWDDDGDVRRMMPAEPTFAPKPEGKTNEALSTVVGAILADGSKRIVVTMAEQADSSGRPLAAVAIARTIARADRRPVLIDLRSDGANSASMGEGADLPGFSDLFAGEASFAQVIFRDRKSRVHFIPGGMHPLAAAQLADERVDLLLSALDHTYDHVILDVADDVIDVVGAGCDAAVVVSQFGADNPHTIRAFERIAAVSEAKMILFVVDPTAAEDSVADDAEAAEGAAA